MPAEGGDCLADSTNWAPDSGGLGRPRTIAQLMFEDEPRLPRSEVLLIPVYTIEAERSVKGDRRFVVWVHS